MSKRTYAGYSADDLRRLHERYKTIWSQEAGIDYTAAARSALPALLDHIASLEADSVRAAALLQACVTINGYRHAARIWREDGPINWYTYPSTGSTASYWTLEGALIALAGEVAK